MYEYMENIFAEFRRKYKDGREHVFDVDFEFTSPNQILIRGRVLEQQIIQALEAAILSIYPALKMDFSQLQVLHHSETPRMWVATNLTSLHAEPSFQAEMVTQALYGMQMEVLEEKKDWGFVRREDGYLGWTYLPYLQSKMISVATHLVVAPSHPLYAQPEPRSERVTRVLAGMPVTLLRTQEDWCFIQANKSGWLPLSALRSLEEIPVNSQARRETMKLDALLMTGVPYLWGGDSANGIDCSGFARLIHLLSGINIRRDADMQYADGRKIDPPFQPGDLLFFGDTVDGQPKITHVTISLGGWEIIHSSRAQNGVYWDNVQQVPHLRDSFLFASTYID